MNQNRYFVGIKNDSGVACHIASAIQLLLHALTVKQLGYLIELSEYFAHHYCKKKQAGHEVSTSKESWQDDDHKEIHFIIYFGSLAARTIITDECDENRIINPKDFYQFLSSKLDSLEAGDASSSLRALIQLLKHSIDLISNKYINKNDTQKVQLLDSEMLLKFKSLRAFLYQTFWNGTISHQLSGSKIVESIDTSDPSCHIKKRMKIMRCKPTKHRPLPAMITIPMTDKGKPNENLIDAFNKIMNQSQPIVGYDWDNEQETDYDQNEIDLGPINEIVKIGSLNLVDNQRQDARNNESSSSSSPSSSSSSSASSVSSSSTSTDSSEGEKWITEKKVWLKHLPNTLLFQLKRFEYRNGKTNVITRRIGIPMEIHLCQFYAKEKCTYDEQNMDSYLLYELSGAIVYTTDKDRNCNYEDDIGHYITYLRKKSNEWIKIDDEKVCTLFASQEEKEMLTQNHTKPKTVSLDQLLKMLGGIENQKGCWCAFVLLYQCNNNRKVS